VSALSYKKRRESGDGNRIMAIFPAHRKHAQLNLTAHWLLDDVG